MNGSINKDPKTLRRFSRGDALPTKLLFAINVARPSAGETQFGTDERPGCHWTMCYIDTIGNKITYGDSLAWQYPSNLLEKVNQYIKAVSSDDDVTNYSIFYCHDPFLSPQDPINVKKTVPCCIPFKRVIASVV